MLKSLIVIVGLLSCLASPASAQVFFEPVQYQYGPSPTFYYGGSDPRVFEHASRSVYSDDIAGPYGSRYFVGTRYYGPIISDRPPAVFVDQVPYFNAALFHYTPADARNAANAAVPTYFRKIDLLRSAIPSGDGKTFVVPAQAPLPQAAGYIDIRPYHRPAPGASTRPSTGPAPATTGPATQPSDGPRPLLIIPKSLLQPPAPAATPAAEKVVVAK
jgi:hypothetical protein